MRRGRLFTLLLLFVLTPVMVWAQDTVLLGSILLKKELKAVALSPNTGIAYGVSQEKTLHIFDLAVRQATDVKLGKEPQGIAVNPQNNLAYITVKAEDNKGYLCIPGTPY